MMDTDTVMLPSFSSSVGGYPTLLLVSMEAGSGHKVTTKNIHPNYTSLSGMTIKIPSVLQAEVIFLPVLQ